VGRGRVPHPTLLALGGAVALLIAEPSLPAERLAAAPPSPSPTATDAASPTAAAPARPVTFGPDQMIMPPAEFPTIGWTVVGDGAVALDPAVRSWRRRFAPSAPDVGSSVTLDISVAAPDASAPLVNCLGLTTPRVPLTADFPAAGVSAITEVPSRLWSSAPFVGRAATTMCRRTYGSNGTVYALMVVSRNVAIAVYVQAGSAATACCSADERPALALAADVGWRQLAILERVAPP
jgi:hypothetical protein